MKCFKYTNRPKSYITVTTLKEPHGEGTETVVSIGCTLKGDMQNPTWKVHVPLDLAESVGQELIRLVRLDREERLKSGAAPKPISRSRTDDMPVVENSKKISPEEMQLHTERAIDQGRVIKRQKRV